MCKSVSLSVCQFVCVIEHEPEWVGYDSYKGSMEVCVSVCLCVFICLSVCPSVCSNMSHSG